MKPRLAIVGMGLMGGSLAAALRVAGFASEIWGIDANPECLTLAGEQGWIDRGVDVMPAEGADIIVLATPVGAMPGILNALGPVLSATTVVTDMGSVKGSITNCAQTLGMHRFIPGHPIAGSERSGPGAARADLFVGRVVVLTPTKECDHEALSQVRAMWEAAGARIVLAQAGHHDRMMAYTSHIPHILAFAYADLLGAQADKTDLLPFVGSGLRDFLRIAGSDPVMWRDICEGNAEVLAAILSAYGEQLRAYGEALTKGDFGGLHDSFVRARALRETLGQEIFYDT